MTDKPEPKISQRYRELGAEEPPRALDEAILAASRRAVQAHPAPLVAPTGRRAWFVPLAAVAILLLAVGVTLHMQLEQPGIDGISPPVENAREAPAPKVAAVKEQQAGETVSRDRPRVEKAAADKPTPSVERREAPKLPISREPKPFVSDTAGAASPEAASSRSAEAAGPVPAAASGGLAAQKNMTEERRERQAAERGVSAAPAAAPVAAKPAPARALSGSLAKHADEAADAPEKELERIARLRRDGKHEEADKALAEFRRRYPDYRIPAAVLERVERR